MPSPHTFNESQYGLVVRTQETWIKYLFCYDWESLYDFRPITISQCDIPQDCCAVGENNYVVKSHVHWRCYTTNKYLSRFVCSRSIPSFLPHSQGPNWIVEDSFPPNTGHLYFPLLCRVPRFLTGGWEGRRGVTITKRKPLKLVLPTLAHPETCPPSQGC